MSKPSSWARWAACALVLAVVAQPALADKRKKKVKARTSIAACTSFEQVDRVDDSVDLVIANSCEIPVACSVSWTVTCAPDSKRTHRHQHGQAFDVSTGFAATATGSAGTCGNDDGVTDDVAWSCQPGAAADEAAPSAR